MFFCVVDRWNGIFFLQDTTLIFHSLQVMDAATDSVDSQKFLSAKKIDQKMRHSVFYCFPQILLLLLHAHSCDTGDHR